MTFPILPRVALLLCVALLTACDQPTGTAGGFDEATSRAQAPADTELASIYDRSCRSCHTVAATGAPLTGDSTVWAARLEKTMPALVDNVINGFGGMPPLGLCMDCDIAEFEALIQFMAAPPAAPPTAP